MTLWAISNAPIFVGDDLTQLDSFGLQLLTNDNAIAVDQTGVPGSQIAGGNNPVWASAELPNGTYNVALFNLNGSSSTTTVNWRSLGISGSADVYDLWDNVDLGNFTGSYSAALNTNASALVRVTPGKQTAPSAPTNLTATAGNGQVALAWAGGSGATSYNIYRGTSSGGETEVDTGISSASFTDTGLTNGKTYYYEATSVNSAGESGKSNEISATPNAAFGVSASSTVITLSGTGGQGTSVLTVTPSGDTRTLSFTCSNLPAAFSCGFSPATLPLAGLSAQQQVIVAVSRLSASLGSGRYPSKSAGRSLPGELIASCFVMWLLFPSKFRRMRRLFVALILCAVTVSLIGCGSSSPSSSTAPSSSSYNFQVNVVADGSIARSIGYTLTVQ